VPTLTLRPLCQCATEHGAPVICASEDPQSSNLDLSNIAGQKEKIPKRIFL
jgi:hypothetical protein